MTMLSVSGLSKGYKGKQAVSDVSFSLEAGEVLGIIGPSGSGKSTLLRLIDLLESPDSGKIEFQGKEVSALNPDACLVRRRMSLVLQKPSAMNRSVSRNIAYGLELRKVDDNEVERRVGEYLKLLKLEEIKDRNARSLSGGEMQRMCFARSVIVEPDLMMFDEFTANLDPKNVRILENALKELQSGGNRASIVVTHNIFQARRICDQLAFLLDGRIVETGKVEQMFKDPKDERTRAFLSGEMVY